MRISDTLVIRMRDLCRCAEGQNPEMLTSHEVMLYMARTWQALDNILTTGADYLPGEWQIAQHTDVQQDH